MPRTELSYDDKPQQFVPIEDRLDGFHQPRMAFIADQTPELRRLLLLGLIQTHAWLVAIEAVLY
jgi:hypothetical protein